MADEQDIMSECEARIPEYVAGRVASNIRLALAALEKQAKDRGKPALRMTIALELERWENGDVAAEAEVVYEPRVKHKDAGERITITARKAESEGMQNDA